ncbi:MAG: transcription-repair coupling factor, partial [Bacteroidales bacterium]|nr:transcription-repair coupling factor [Bacteroidales bacterium]
MVLVHDDADQAAYLYHDLVHFFGKEQVLMLPASFKKSIKYGQDDAGNNILRTVVLSALQNQEKKIIVAYPESFLEKVLPREELQKQTLCLHKGEKVDTDFIIHLLQDFGFQQSDYVYEPGQFALRGSLIDVYSWSNELPYRIDFFGDEIESIRSFEVETQLSKEMFEEIRIIPENKQDMSKAVPVWNYFSADSL